MFPVMQIFDIRSLQNSPHDTTTECHVTCVYCVMTSSNKIEMHFNWIWSKDEKSIMHWLPEKENNMVTVKVLGEVGH